MDRAAVRVRVAEALDLPRVCAIERASFSDPWTRAMFTAHLAAESDTFLVAVTDTAVAGYAIVRVIGDDSELLNIAVAPDHRRAGAGAQLLDSAIAAARGVGAAEMWLEVRESNAGAQALYASRGFVAVGRRKHYYESPREDALVLRAPLHASAGSELVPQADAGLSGPKAARILSPASQLPRQEIR